MFAKHCYGIQALSIHIIKRSVIISLVYIGQIGNENDSFALQHSHHTQKSYKHTQPETRHTLHFHPYFYQELLTPKQYMHWWLKGNVQCGTRVMNSTMTRDTIIKWVHSQVIYTFGRIWLWNARIEGLAAAKVTVFKWKPCWRLYYVWN